MSKTKSWGMAVLLLAAGCSGGSSYSESVTDIARAYCEFVFECSDETRPSMLETVARIGTMERCVEFFRGESSHGRLEAIEQSIRDGSIAYDARAARACARAIRNLDGCFTELLEVTFESTQACDEILAGQVAPGGSCAFDEQCTRGHECAVPAGTCGGTCVVDLDAPTTYRATPAGGACGRTDECLDGLFCYDGLCRSASVSETAIAGAECETLVETNTALTLVTCLPSLGCVENADGDDVCAPPLALGAECSRGDSCVAGSFCLEDVGGTGTYTCKEYVIVRKVGDTCNADPFEEGSQRFCDHGRGLYCSAAGTCAALGDGSLDSACRSPDGLEDQNRIFCNAGLYCDDDTRTCRPLRAADAACDDDDQCESSQCNPGGTCEASYVECRGGLVF